MFKYYFERRSHNFVNEPHLIQLAGDGGPEPGHL